MIATPTGASCPRHPDGIRDMHRDCKACDKASALAELRALCPPGTTVYTILRSVSRSGMSRVISPVILNPDTAEHERRGAMLDLSHLVGKVLDLPRKDGWHYNAVKVGGGGMDMGFHMVYSLSHALYPNGYTCIGEKPIRCDSNDHSNGDRNYKPHQHSNGGYALSHRWL